MLLSMIGLLWFDTIWALPSSFRWYATRLGFAIASLFLLALIIHRVRRINNDQIAEQIDRAINSGGEILAGWQLTTFPVQPRNELSSGLASLASERAAAKLAAISPARVAKWGMLKQPAILFASVLVFVLVIAAVLPNVAWYQIQRFLYPTSDLPPYTGVVIELELEKPSILYGHDLLVVARVKGGKVERMTLVAEADGSQDQVLPMLAQEQDSWQSMLTRVKQPITIYARSGASRSKKYHLDVQMTPQINPPVITIRPPAYTKTSPIEGRFPSKESSDWRVQKSNGRCQAIDRFKKEC